MRINGWRWHRDDTGMTQGRPPALFPLFSGLETDVIPGSSISLVCDLPLVPISDAGLAQFA